jgi:putative heme-binding domain-containing protein
LDELAERFASDGAPAAEQVSRLVATAGQVAQDSQIPLSRRTNAVTLLGEFDYGRAGPALVALLTPTQPKAVQLTAARALAGFDSLEAARALLSPERWPAFPPAVREIVLSRLLSRPRQLPAVLDAVEGGTIPAWAIPAARRKQLLQDKDAVIQSRAARLFAIEGQPDRRKVYEEYKPLLAFKGSQANGHGVFLRVCATCHQHSGEGAKVGPDLTGVNNQPAEALLLHIIVPDAEIYAGFESYDCETKDGRSLSGILAGETQTSVTLRRALGEQDVIPRDQMVSLQASRTSLMPSELEKTMTRQELTDLLTFLKAGP